MVLSARKVSQPRPRDNLLDARNPRPQNSRVHDRKTNWIPDRVGSHARRTSDRRAGRRLAHVRPRSTRRALLAARRHHTRERRVAPGRVDIQHGRRLSAATRPADGLRGDAAPRRRHAVPGGGTVKRAVCFSRTSARRALRDADWMHVLGEIPAALRCLAGPNPTVTSDERGQVVLDLDADPRNADWLRLATAARKARHHLPLWSAALVSHVAVASRPQAQCQLLGRCGPDRGAEAIPEDRAGSRIASRERPASDHRPAGVGLNRDRTVLPPTPASAPRAPLPVGAGRPVPNKSVSAVPCESVSSRLATWRHSGL
jgi:hypothetical protein